MSNKRYGLFIPKKKEYPSKNVSSQLLEDNDEPLKKDVPQEKKKFSNSSSIQMRQAMAIQQKALLEDPNIFEYDEVYDEMKAKKDEECQVKETKKEPKYIGRLLNQAKKRQLENERRIERQVQKEREAEGSEFKDKEAFVTSAYKEKLIELRKVEEEEKREEYLEKIGDVTKQSNLDGFYRHLYEQKLGPNKSSDEQKLGLKESSDVKDKSDQSSKNVKSKKVYRKRQLSEDNEPDNENEIKKMHIQSNLDADSDFSIDESSDESDDEASNVKNIKIEKEEEKILKLTPPNPSIDKSNASSEKLLISHEKEEDNTENDESENSKKKVSKPKIDIWAKRTIGIVFEDALQRYYERKNNRNL